MCVCVCVCECVVVSTHNGNLINIHKHTYSSTRECGTHSAGGVEGEGGFWGKGERGKNLQSVPIN